MGCTEQLLINKAVTLKVKKKTQNLEKINSVPHEWLIYALQLAKLLKQLIKSVKHLTTQ